MSYAGVVPFAAFLGQNWPEKCKIKYICRTLVGPTRNAAQPSVTITTMDDATPLYSAEQIVVPEELAEVLKLYTKAVIRAQPANILEFSAKYALSCSQTSVVSPRHHLITVFRYFEDLSRTKGRGIPFFFSHLIPHPSPLTPHFPLPTSHFHFSFLLLSY